MKPERKGLEDAKHGLQLADGCQQSQNYRRLTAAHLPILLRAQDLPELSAPCCPFVHSLRRNLPQQVNVSRVLKTKAEKQTH